MMNENYGPIPWHVPEIIVVTAAVVLMLAAIMLGIWLSRTPKPRHWSRSAIGTLVLFSFAAACVMSVVDLLDRVHDARWLETLFVHGEIVEVRRHDDQANYELRMPNGAMYPYVVVGDFREFPVDRLIGFSAVFGTVMALLMVTTRGVLLRRRRGREGSSVREPGRL